MGRVCLTAPLLTEGKMGIPKLDPDNIDMIVTCMVCKEPLWEMKILSRDGGLPMSTEYKPIGDVPKFSEYNKDCPKCGQQFFKVEGPKQEHVYRMYDKRSQTIIWV